MADTNTPKTIRNSQHPWKFFRAGGFDQVRLESGQDLTALPQLDQKLWIALSCPITGLEFDRKTLELIDSDGDGRIRVPEVIAAVTWATSMLRNPDDILKGTAELPLTAIDDGSLEGSRLLASAKHILANLGKEDAPAISLTDTTDTARIFAQTRFNGDGVIPPDSSDDPEIQKIIVDIMECLGENLDRSEKQGVSQEKVDRFFADIQAYSVWWREAETQSTVIKPLGVATESAAAAFNEIQPKVEDYFARCRLAAFDVRALSALNRQETEYIAIAEKSLSSSVDEVSGFPLAMIAVGNRPLPLKEGINPAWIVPMENFTSTVIQPLLGNRDSLTEAEWEQIRSTFAPFHAWQSRKEGASIEQIGIDRAREIVAANAKDAIDELLAKDMALAPEFDAIACVDRLVRYHRDLFTLLNNFVSFSDFYTRKDKALFQAGTLYLDGRSCDLCVRVEDIGKHASLATLSRTYLAYCRCTRNAGDGVTEEMNIAAAFTDGDADYLMVGRNGVFYDRKGQDWDATIARVIEHPISIRQAFWSPYKRIAKMINEQIEKMAASRDKASTDKASAGIAGGAQKIEVGISTVPAKPPFDVAKFAGIFAAIGLAVGAIGTAIAAGITGFMQLVWWKMPLAIAGIIMLISGPSMIIAWLKLRQRTLGPILDANGWAVNARARINIAFGRSLTKVASLPPGAERSLEDPFADKKSKWPQILVVVIVLSLLFYFLNGKALVLKLLANIFGI
ncbi:MAG: hypothetical protein M0Q01_12010 [Syntrophales bacterium]|jgi:hypothetical protein|nr:hypothetical protein [Syntrophales bacterium]